MYIKKNLISLMSYIGIGFVAGSISHGFFSHTRSLLMAGLGIIIFVIAEYMKGGSKDYTHLIAGGLFYAIAVGMVSGGLQHFLDSPTRSLWIVPVGLIASTALFPYYYQEKSENYTKSIIASIIIACVVAIILWLLIHTLPVSWFAVHTH